MVAGEPSEYLKIFGFSMPMPQQSGAAVVALDEKLAKLGYQGNSDMPKDSCHKAPAQPGALRRNELRSPRPAPDGSQRDRPAAPIGIV